MPVENLLILKKPIKTNQMRKVIYGINLSLDGCCDHAKFSGGKDILEHFTRLMDDVDLIVYGRKTFELMVPYWPDAAKDPLSTKEEKEFAQAFDGIEKLVFSRTLTGTNDKNSVISQANPGDEIRKLKQQAGGNISIGGVNLPLQLIELGLVDEFHYVIHPVIVGEGRSLLEAAGLKENVGLKLIESKILESGCIALHYVKN
ncbi:Dihydrofolate reductase [Mucilaginibacter gossypii]|uniref:Dihydrofolate reductase n=2 Tax=Sphingobacteriaceae TaxID=84566 RepID=A0A1G7MSY4_9SPHI|nr:Dihydrofolate reductase [Mucilaginibacter gossypii]